MTYATPQLTLIGQAAGLVLGFATIGSLSKLDPDRVTYDAMHFLETEW